jgi:hypothetical protein
MVGVGGLVVIIIPFMIFFYCLSIALALKYGSRIIGSRTMSGRLPKELWVLGSTSFCAGLFATFVGYIAAVLFFARFGKLAGGVTTGLTYFFLMTVLSFLVLYPKDYNFSNGIEIVVKPIILSLLSILLACAASYAIHELLSFLMFHD